MNRPKFDPNKYHRHSIRLKEYDYASSGAYFVTIVTAKRQCLFGEIVGQEMQLNQFGKIVHIEWEQTSIVRPHVETGAYVIMPNHVHGILIFHDADVVVGATRRVAPTKTLQPNSLGAIMAQIKSIGAKRINALRDTPRRPCGNAITMNTLSAMKKKWKRFGLTSMPTLHNGIWTKKTQEEVNFMKDSLPVVFGAGPAGQATTHQLTK